jgi:hypothetical protein
MKKIKHTIFLEKLENILDRQLSEVIKVYQNLSDDVMLQPPATGGWSIASCIEHLNTYARYYVPRVEKSFENTVAVSTSYTYTHSWIGGYLIGIMDTEKSKQKFKAIKQHQPQSLLEPSKVVSEFIQHLEHLLHIVKLAETKDIRKGKIATSMSGFIRMSPGEVLHFLLVHNERHLLQARQNLPKNDG